MKEDFQASNTVSLSKSQAISPLSIRSMCSQDQNSASKGTWMCNTVRKKAGC